MENKNNNYDFEKFIREGLNNVPAEPDANTWDQIANRQQPKNFWKQVLHYGKFAAPVILVVLIGTALWWSNGNAGDSNNPGNQQQIQQPATDQAVANAESENANNTLVNPNTSANHPYIAPIRPSWYSSNTVPAQTVTFSAENGLSYQNPVSGNRVEIPANSLVYPDGTPVNGEVKLLFREYRTIADFLASNMPMHYSDQRGDFAFNSGGMFEVRVSQNGTDLQMAPGRNYTVKFKPTDDLQAANLYYLPDATNKWGHQVPEDELTMTVLDPIGLPKVLDESTVVSDNVDGKPGNCLPAQLVVPTQEDPVDWVKDAVLTGQEYANGKINPPGWFRKNADKPDGFFTAGLERSEIRVVHQRDQQDLFFPEDLKHVFTELNAFKNCYFIRRTDTSIIAGRSVVDNMFRKQKIWTRVEVWPDTISGYCTLILGNGDDEIQIPAILTRSNEAKNASAFNASARFAEYTRLRTVRHNEFRAILNKWRHFVKVSDMFQPAEEWCMQEAEWFDFFDKNKEMMKARYDALYNAGYTENRQLAQTSYDSWMDKVRKLYFAAYDKGAQNLSLTQNMLVSLKVTGFGTYNCDQIFQLFGRNNQQKYLQALYETKDGRRIQAGTIRIVEKETRLFFSLPDRSVVPRLPGRQINLIINGVDGRTYYCSGADYAALDLANVDRQKFILTDVTDKVKTPSDWAQLLNI